MHRVAGKEFAEFAIELGGEGFVVRDDERGLIILGDDLGHRECLARTRHAEQNLMLFASFESCGDFLDRLRLVARRLVFR